MDLLRGAVIQRETASGNAALGADFAEHPMEILLIEHALFPQILCPILKFQVFAQVIFAGCIHSQSSILLPVFPESREISLSFPEILIRVKARP